MIKKIKFRNKTTTKRARGVAFSKKILYDNLKKKKQKENSQAEHAASHRTAKKSCPEKKKWSLFQQKTKNQGKSTYGILRRDDVNHRTEK